MSIMAILNQLHIETHIACLPSLLTTNILDVPTYAIGSNKRLEFESHAFHDAVILLTPRRRPRDTSKDEVKLRKKFKS